MRYNSQRQQTNRTSSRSFIQKDYLFHSPELDSLFRFISLVILFWIISFISKLIWVDMVVIYDARQTNRVETWAIIENERAYQFLTKSAHQYYTNRSYRQALQELRLAHRIYPTRYEVNYLNTVTLIGLCKQRGIYCDEAVASLNYLDDNWILDKEWLETQSLTLGILEQE